MVNRGLSRWFSGKESTCNAGDMSLIPGSGRWLGGGNDNPLQYSCLGCPVDREVWRVTVHGVAKMSDTLNNNNMANKVSHLLLILLPGDLKQITYLCQYVYLEYRLFFKMQTYITTVKTKQNRNCIKYPGRIHIFQPFHIFQYLICFLFIVCSNQDK